MSAIVLETQTDTLPPNNTKWQMYNISKEGCSKSAWYWHFTNNYQVHDEPEVWTGNWEQINAHHIKIHRTDLSGGECTYDIPLITSSFFVAFEPIGKSILIGVLEQMKYPSSLDYIEWAIYDVLDDCKLESIRDIWHFTFNNRIHDDPTDHIEMWDGFWTKTSDPQIQEISSIEISRKDYQSPHNEYKYNVPLITPAFFVAFGKDEHADKRILLGIRKNLT